MSENKITKTIMLCLNWDKLRKIDKAVIPVVVQDYRTKEVLILAYTNKEAFKETVRTKIASFWSTSRNKLWIKGDESGNRLKVIEIRINCEQNSLLYLVEPVNNCGACHVRDKNKNYYLSCYYRKLIIDLKNISLQFIN